MIERFIHFNFDILAESSDCVTKSETTFSLARYWGHVAEYRARRSRSTRYWTRRNNLSREGPHRRLISRESPYNLFLRCRAWCSLSVKIVHLIRLFLLVKLKYWLKHIWNLLIVMWKKFDKNKIDKSRFSSLYYCKNMKSIVLKKWHD